MDFLYPYLAIAGVIIIYGIALVAYRLFCHPLRGFPGPKRAAATAWYEFYFDVLKKPGGTFMYEIERMHAEHGPIVRINPEEIHIKDSDWFGTLYCGPTAGIRDKYPRAANMMGTPLSSFGTIAHEHHRKRRGAYSSFFSKAAVATSEPSIHSYVETAGRKLLDAISSNKVIELRTFYLAMVVDILCEHAFGKPLGLCANEQASVDWKRTVDTTARLTPVIKQMTWLYPITNRLPIQVMQTLAPDLARIVSLRRELQERAKIVLGSFAPTMNTKSNNIDAAAEPRNIFQSILNSSLSSKEKEPARMAQEAFVVQVGGGETTAHALTDITYHLLANKDTALRTLKEELFTVMPDPRARVELKTLEKLPYLTAVIKEGLRVGAFLTARSPLVSPKEPMYYGNWRIPPGTPISMTQRDVLLDPSVFPNPRRFYPERWLQQPGPEFERMNAAFVPFSRGSRNCVGMNFAMAELRIITACLFRRFDLELYDTTWERDVDIVRDCHIGEVSSDSLGVRVKVVGVNT